MQGEGKRCCLEFPKLLITDGSASQPVLVCGFCYISQTRALLLFRTWLVPVLICAGAGCLAFLATHLTALGQMRAALLARVQSGLSLAAQHTAYGQRSVTVTTSVCVCQKARKVTLLILLSNQPGKPAHKVPGSASTAANLWRLGVAMLCMPAEMCSRPYVYTPVSRSHLAGTRTCCSAPSSRSRNLRVHLSGSFASTSGRIA